jgi:hypothetical protein
MLEAAYEYGGHAGAVKRTYEIGACLVPGLRTFTTIKGLKSGIAKSKAGPLPNTVKGRPPTDPNRPVTAPRGPETLRLGERRDIGSIWLRPPAIFTTDPHSSALEWKLYLAHALYHDRPRNPLEPPYEGWPGLWAFQVPEMEGAARQVTSSVSDFVNFMPYGEVIIRLDTFHFHTAAGAAQQARDLYLVLQAEKEGRIVRRIYDEQLMGDDETGQKYVRALADVLAGRELIPPVRSGLAFAPREAVAEVMDQGGELGL